MRSFCELYLFDHGKKGPLFGLNFAVSVDDIAERTPKSGPIGQGKFFDRGDIGWNLSRIRHHGFNGELQLVEQVSGERNGQMSGPVDHQQFFLSENQNPIDLFAVRITIRLGCDDQEGQAWPEQGAKLVGIRSLTALLFANADIRGGPVEAEAFKEKLFSSQVLAICRGDTRNTAENKTAARVTEQAEPADVPVIVRLSDVVRNEWAVRRVSLAIDVINQNPNGVDGLRSGRGHVRCFVNVNVRNLIDLWWRPNPRPCRADQPINNIHSFNPSKVLKRLQPQGDSPKRNSFAGCNFTPFPTAEDAA